MASRKSFGNKFNTQLKALIRFGRTSNEDVKFVKLLLGLECSREVHTMFDFLQLCRKTLS